MGRCFFKKLEIVLEADCTNHKPTFNLTDIMNYLFVLEGFFMKMAN